MIIYAFVHKKKLVDVCLNPSMSKCHGISTTAEEFQYYNSKKFPVYNLSNEIVFTRHSSGLLSLPEHILVRIIKCLSNEFKLNCMLSCKQLFHIVSSYCQPSFTSNTDVTLHPVKGICVNYKFTFDLDRTKKDLTICTYLKKKLAYQIDPDLCVCPLCHETCSCDYSKQQHASQLKKLLFNKCNLGTVIIRSSADFKYMIENLNNIPRCLKIDVPIGKYSLYSLFDKFRYYKSLDYILDVRMFTHIELLRPLTAPVVDRLHIRFLPTNSSHPTDVPVVRTILRNHLKAIKKTTQGMKKLTLTNCLILDEVFYFSPLNKNFIWTRVIKELIINNCKIKCSLFKQLGNLTSLSLLCINRSEIESKCKASHFNHYFRSDFLNFELVPNTKHFLFKRNSFLSILCDMSDTHCPCIDVKKKPLSSRLLYGRFILQKCEKCILPPKECNA